MKISKVLNNSCVVVLDDNEKELVLFGNGIGYAKRNGDAVDKTKIDKVFVMQDERKLDRFSELVQRVPEEVIAVSEELIEEAHEEKGMQLNESIHISLADHIAGALENYRSGIVLHNTLLLEIRKFYQKEYELGEKALSLIDERFGIHMADDEAGFVAMHFVDAQSIAENDQTRTIITLVDEMDRIISRTFGKEMAKLDKTSLVYCRYMTHLKFFAQRVLTKTYFEANDIADLDVTLKRYTKEYRCSREVCEYIEKNYRYTVNEEEIVYLTVHLVQIMRRRG